MFGAVLGIILAKAIDGYGTEERKDGKAELLEQRILFLEEFKTRMPAGGVVAPAAQATRPAPVMVGGEAKEGAVDTDPEDACTVCALKHLSRASGLIGEASQMLASYDFVSPTIQGRIDTVAENLGALEDWDWSPAKLSRSTPEDRALVEKFYPKVRELRRKVLTVQNPQELEQTAGAMKKLSTDYRIAFLESRGLDMSQPAV